MQNYLLSRAEADGDLHFCLISMADLDRPPTSHATIHDKDTPTVSVSESCTPGNFKDSISFPGHDRSFHTESIPESFWRIDEVRDHVDALLLDS
jgi:hypothetical protein